MYIHIYIYLYTYKYTYIHMYMYRHPNVIKVARINFMRDTVLIQLSPTFAPMGWLRLVGYLKLQVSFAEYLLVCRSLFH